MHDPNDPNDTVTITLGDDPMDITMNTTTTSSFADDVITVDFSDISDDLNLTSSTIQPLDFSDFDYDSTITIGSSKISEEKIQLLDALIEAIENLPEENELRSLFDNVRMLNKLKNAD